MLRKAIVFMITSGLASKLYRMYRDKKAVRPVTAQQAPRPRKPLRSV